MPGVTLEGLEALQKKLGTLTALQENYLKPVTQEAVLYVHSTIPEYPNRPTEPYPFVSQKQRIFVIIAIKTGEIDVPYRRTGSVGRSITTHVSEVGNNVVGIIGTSLENAGWVISSEPSPIGGPQAAYHKKRWWTLQGVVADAWPQVLEIYQKRLNELLNS